MTVHAAARSARAITPEVLPRLTYFFFGGVFLSSFAGITVTVAVCVDAAARRVHERGQRNRTLRANFEPDLFERRINLRVQSPERLAHLRGPLVVDLKLLRFLPTVLERVE